MKLFLSKNRFVEIDDSKVSEIKSKCMRHIPLSAEEIKIKGWMDTTRNFKRSARNQMEEVKAFLGI